MSADRPVKTRLILFMGLWLVVLLATACSVPVKTSDLGPVPVGLRDGVYQGQAEHFPGRAMVEIVIEDGFLTQVRLLEHRYGLGGQAGLVIPDRIVQVQSTDVDAVSGATGSSIIIMMAVQNALSLARPGP
jgi:uncharacterized protein with FMN-binding domain